MRPNIRQFHILLICLILLLSATEIKATTLIIPPVSVKSGHTFTVPIKIDQVDNLAGIKLVIHYNAGLIKYEKAQKAEPASSFMHVVNDKNPGTLIIVMAGAKGIKGKDIEIMSLTFQSKSFDGLQGIQESRMDIVEIQMMNDQLKEVTCKIEINPIFIAP